MISSISLQNFKCYQQQSFDFSNLTIFCGNNSVGKSTAIQAFTLLLQAKFAEKIPFNGDLVCLGYYEDIHYFHNDQDDTIGIDISFDGNEVCWRGASERSNEDVLMRRETVPSSIEYFEKHLQSFQYIQAERLGPRDNYSNSQSLHHSDWLGASGEYTAEVLARIDGNKRFMHLSPDNKLVPNQNDCRIHPATKSYQVSHSIEAWMAEISPGFTLQSKTERMANVSYNAFQQHDGKNIRPANVGFGLSYALSVVTALVNAPVGGLLIIENPEAHIHPRGQSYLGRLIALTAEAGVQVVIETHSDHVINGIRVVAKCRESFRSDLFKLYFVSAGEKNEQSQVEAITLNDQGKLSNWPDGFFDQQTLDMTSIITGHQ
jgi:predicted ATPase